MAPALVGLVQGSISAATYAATEKIAYGRNPSITDTLIVGVTSGVMAGGTQFIGQKLGIIQCFIEGTLVATNAGLVPIEDIQAGDYVWATDEETGETALKEVVQTFRNETEEWVHVKVNGEEITCTPMHPFYVPQNGWTSAVDLRAGDILVMLNGEYVVVEQVQHELLESPETTYNFEVEDYHTYYVGDTSVWVHNVCKAAKKAQLPTKGKVRYVPPKNAGNNLPRTANGGYVDKFNNVWQKGPSRTIGEAFEWDVQLSRQGKNMLGWLSRDGAHLNVSLRGIITH